MGPTASGRTGEKVASGEAEQDCADTRYVYTVRMKLNNIIFNMGPKGGVSLLDLLVQAAQIDQGPNLVGHLCI